MFSLDCASMVYIYIYNNATFVKQAHRCIFYYDDLAMFSFAEFSPIRERKKLKSSQLGFKPDVFTTNHWRDAWYSIALL